MVEEPEPTPKPEREDPEDPAREKYQKAVKAARAAVVVGFRAKNVKKKKTYYCRLRPYTTLTDSDTGEKIKVWGAWAGTLKGKIKK